MILINGVQNISDVFSIFHDGDIIKYEVEGSNLKLFIHIQYLAERISTEYRIFKLSLVGLNKIEFSPWFDDLNRTEPPITNIEKIFRPKLEVLSSKVEGNALFVCFNQAEPGHGYCGGDIRMEVKAATVQDEGGKYYSFDQLEALCSSYWKEWSDKNS